VNLARVRLLDELCARAWTPLEEEESDGWILRASGGFSLRGNSVWPREAHGAKSLADRIARAEDFYFAHGLPPRFQISPASEPPGLERELQRHGYVVHTTTDVMTASGGVTEPQSQVELCEQSTDLWRSVMLDSSTDLDDAKGRLAIVDGMRLHRRHAIICIEGAAAAIGLGTVDRGWLGVFAMRTLPQYRRRGLARSIVAALRDWAASEGAREAYLQVESDNAPAIALYRSLGFVREYSYRYSSRAGG